METALDFLFSERGLALAAWAAGIVWAYIQRRKWVGDGKNANYARALECIKNAVAVTYETYVRSIKASKEDGKLTDAERKEALQRAKDAAISYGMNEGVDILQVIGQDVFTAVVNRTVREAKRSEKSDKGLKSWFDPTEVARRTGKG